MVGAFHLSRQLRVVNKRSQRNKCRGFDRQGRAWSVGLITITALAVLAPGLLVPFFTAGAGLFRCPLLLWRVGVLRLVEVGIVRHGVVIHAWVVRGWRVLRCVVYQLADGLAA